MDRKTSGYEIMCRATLTSVTLTNWMQIIQTHTVYQSNIIVKSMNNLSCGTKPDKCQSDPDETLNVTD